MDSKQRVSPMDVESSYTNPAPPLPPKYVMLSEQNGDPSAIRPPPYRRNVPPRYRSGSSHKKGKGFCIKCLCCCYCFLLILVLTLAGTIIYLYKFYQPQIPSYKVQNLNVTAFDIQVDFSLYTEFVVSVKAENPNKKIGIIYGQDSMVVVVYNGSMLSSGKLPAFYQGHQNTTTVSVVLKGKSEFGSGLQEALMQNKHTGRIPLTIKVKAPVSIVLGELPLRQFVVLVNCSLIIDNLAPHRKIGILSSKYNVKVQL